MDGMATRRRGDVVGAEVARQQLPDLLDRARRGGTTIITKRGEPHAALVPPESARSRSRVSVARLHGSGRGLWGNVARHVEAIRRDW